MKIGPALALACAAAAAAALLPPPARAWRRGRGYSVEETIQGGVSSPGTPAAGTAIGDGYHPFSDFGKAAGAAPAAAPGAAAAPAAPALPFGSQDPGVRSGWTEPSKESSSSSSSGSEEPAAPVEVKPAETPLADAAANFETVVETYLAKNGSDGAWPYKLKGRTLRLELVSVDAAHLKKAGEGLFAGSAVLRDVRTRRRVTLEFTADFTGPEWTVASVRPAAAARR